MMRLFNVFLVASALGSVSLAATAADTDELTGIVVTGIRASLEKSLDIKKNAPVIVDSINATELGRFPDDDVADSLSHITGISISRTTGGEGLYVGVRGLPSSYNIVTLNNRILATDDDGRDLAFDVLPSDVISGADVLKSPEASAIEGSIGGTVNLRSARPFDNPGFHSVVRAERTYNDMSYFSGSKESAFASNTFNDNTMGFLVGAVLSDQKTRTDALNYNTYDPNSPGVWPLSGSTPVVAECCISFGSIIDEKKREALSGTFEWRPSSDFHLAIDGLATWLHDPQVAYNESYFPGFAFAAPGTPAIPGNGYAGCPASTAPTGCPEWTNVVVKNGYITSFTGNNFTPEMINNTIDRVVDTILVGANAGWTASPTLSFKADVYLSRANRPEGGNDAFVTAGLVSPNQYNQNIINWTNTNGGLPNISVTLPDGQDFGQALAAGKLNNNFWNTHYVGLSGYTIHDEVKGATLDGTLKIDKGNLDHFDFGVAETLRDKSRWDVSNDWTNGSSQYNFYTTPQCPNGPGGSLVACGPVLTFGSMGANVISTAHLPNFMQGSGGSFPTTIGVFNVSTLLAALKKLDGQQVLGASPGTVFNFSQTLPQFNAVNSYNVAEHSTALYGELTFSGSNWSGNAGLRMARTATTSSTGQDNIESITVIGTSVPTAPATVVYSTPTPVSSSSSYTIPMPAANFAMWLQPEKLQLRVAAAETMTRPELNQLAPTRTDNTLNQVYELTYSGNASLKPIRSYQADVSLEWYYQPNSALTLAIFGKKLKDFITTGTVYNVNIGALGYFTVDPNGVPPKVGVPVLYTVFEPINGDRGTDSGIEIAEQHFWGNGFGVRGEYTHNWSKAYVQGQFVGQLEGVSPSTASLGLIYEKGPISSNISWDYSGKFVAATFTEVPNVTAISNSFNWVTASLSYQITRDLKLYVSGKNLTNSIARTFLAGRSDLIWSSGSTGTSSSVGQGYSAYGRTVTVGVSLRF
jgi:iron complex outermembrane recepter protein